MSLISLVYVSFESYPLSDEELKKILNTARTFNSANDITGMLLIRDGFFIQALEGESSIVEALYERILHDPRHKNVIRIYTNKISQRSFTKWSMGFNRVTDDDLKDLPEVTDFLNNKSATNVFIEQPSYATRLLEAFRDRIYF
jgi:hypothetical protein